MSAHKFYREIVLHDDECQIGFVSRLARANGYRDLAEFCWMTNFNLSALQCLDADRAELLAEWSGVPAESLQRFALRGNNVTSFGATHVRRSQLETARLRVCRRCLCHDMQTGQGRVVTRPYVRAAWRWLVIGSCPIHGCELEAIDTDDIAAWGARRGDSLAVNLPEIRQPNPTDIYFAGRVTGAGETSGFLDQLPGYVAAEFCTIMGHLKTSLENEGVGRRVPDGFMNRSCLYDGYPIAQDGHDAINFFLSQYVSTYIQNVAEFKNLYSTARRWLGKRVDDLDYRPVVELFQDHAEKNIPLEAGDVFLTRVSERHVHTISSAAIEYRLTPERVRSVLQKQGLSSVDQDGGVVVARVFPRATLHKHLVLESQLLTTPEAASILGCTWQFVDLLLQQGHLPYQTNSEDNQRVFRRITRQSVDGLLNRLRAQSYGISKEELVTINMATAICHCKVPEIVALIFGGKLKRVSWSGKALMLKNLLVDVQEVLPHVTLGDAENYLDVAALEKELRTTTATVDELLKRQFLPVKMRPHPRTRINQRFVHPSALKQFLDEHISLSALARENGKQIAALKRILDEKGIEPIFEPTGKIARFYRRADVQRLGFA
ncbi:MAG TPA: TniQ family protein [Ensifer sp.]|nr:TniQ family protein [Ensifer sp.]